jgi:hypothetical protein
LPLRNRMAWGPLLALKILKLLLRARLVHLLSL